MQAQVVTVSNKQSRQRDFEINLRWFPFFKNIYTAVTLPPGGGRLWHFVPGNSLRRWEKMFLPVNIWGHSGEADGFYLPGSSSLRRNTHFLLLVTSDLSVCFLNIYIYIHIRTFFLLAEALKLPFTVCELWIMEAAARRCNNSSVSPLQQLFCREKFQPLAANCFLIFGAYFQQGSGRHIPLFFLFFLSWYRLHVGTSTGA